MSIKNKNTLNILGETPGKDHLKIKGSKLPTYKQVLMCLLANIKQMTLLGFNNKNIKSEAIKKVMREVVAVYEKAGVTLTCPNLSTNRIKQLYNEYNKLKKSEKYVDNPPGYFSKTMPFWSKNYKESLTKKLRSKVLGEVERNRIEEDLKFFESMMTDRFATLGKKDIPLERKRRISNEKNPKANSCGFCIVISIL